MKKWMKVIVIIAIVVVVFFVGIEVAYNIFVDECCSCCDDSAEYCITSCCKCNYNTFEKLGKIIENIKD